ncbi:restriction endonuclease [Aeromonas veronii]|uniref:restriction endonuclease n=1 Tax=Aeromonas veronii TaxID=654 RepID=UPI0009B856C0|nr:restriction endonuclease [Aeromonas veronii]
MIKRQYYKKLIELDHGVDDYGKKDTGCLIERSFKTGLCPVCNSLLKNYHSKPQFADEDYRPPEPWLIMHSILCICSLCYWWHSTKVGKINGVGLNTYSPKMHYPVLEEIDISSNAIAIDELKLILLKNWEDRKNICAGAAESLVQSILKEHLSCDVHTSTANANAPDGGIDLHVCSKNGNIISAVQVKRRISRHSESVSEVRNFVGAMEIEGINKGIFVTTADRFTKSANDIPEKLKAANSRLELQLIDGQRLFELLKCQVRPDTLIMPPDIDEKSIWIGECGNRFTTQALIYAE